MICIPDDLPSVGWHVAPLGKEMDEESAGELAGHLQGTGGCMAVPATYYDSWCVYVCPDDPEKYDLAAVVLAVHAWGMAS